MKRLEFIGFDLIRRDPAKLLTKLQATYPKTPESALLMMARVELTKRKPRLDHTCAYLFGQDVLTDDLTAIDAWHAVDPRARAWLQKHARRGTLASVIAVDGLSKSYAFTKRSQWIQEVADADLPLIRKSKAVGWFRDYDVFGPWSEPLAWDFPVAERYEAKTLDDAARFSADVRRKKQWAGR